MLEVAWVTAVECSMSSRCGQLESYPSVTLKSARDGNVPGRKGRYNRRSVEFTVCEARERIFRSCSAVQVKSMHGSRDHFTAEYLPKPRRKMSSMVGRKR